MKLLLKSRKSQKGFTLVEIIAVLVILGILAAVAVPKYIDLTKEAETKSVAAVKAELQSRANMYYAQYLLDKTSTKNAQNLAAWATETVGTDFTLGTSGTDIKITSTASTKAYKVTFTQGTVTAAAIFGSITAL